jgi:aryl-alcohol dehydrogenase-like predicted oxidoreductase
MEYRQLGQTGLMVSALGFGCGAVGGLLVGGDPAEMRRAVARAIDGGVTYFDTAPLYGGGRSEENLGAILHELRADVVVGTKVRVATEDLGAIEAAVARSVDQSLARLRRESLDLIQLHNSVGAARIPAREWLSVEDVGRVAEAFRALQRAGKVRHWGINGLGERAALHAALGCGAQTIQCCFSLINPTAGEPAPPGFPFQDYGQLIDRAAARGIGVIAIRVLAAGALSGSPARHPNAAQRVEPIASGESLESDAAWARRFGALVDAGYAASLPEAAIRFAIGKPEVATSLVGISSIGQLEEALAAAGRGALPDAALAQAREIWRGA